MSEIPSNDYLENVSDKINNNEAMRSEIDTVLKTSSDEQVKLGVETISKMNAKQLAYYIESTFKNSEGWADYQTMLRNPYYAFMVQAAIDLLSDHFGNKKYDKDGNEDSNNGKSLDDWLGNNGIDGLIGSKTRTAVGIVQKLLGINVVDGAAGPQFFEAVCAELKGESVSSDFKVRNKPKYTEKYNFNGKEQTVTISQNGVDVKNAEETTISFKLPNGYSLGNVQADGQIHILKAGNDTGCYLVKNSVTNKYEIKYIAGYDPTVRGEFTINPETNVITYKGPTDVEQGIQSKEQAIKSDLNKIDGNYDLRAAVQDLNGNITYVTLGNGSLSVYNDFSGDRAKIDLNNSVVYKDYRNSAFYKNIYSSIDVTGGNWLDDISHTKFEDIQPILNDYPNLDGNFSTESYIDIGTRIPRHTRWYESFRQKLGSRFVGRNIGDGHPSGRDFVDWCNDMKKNGCANYGKLTISEWIAFNTKFSKESISKIYM